MCRSGLRHPARRLQKRVKVLLCEEPSQPGSGSVICDRAARDGQGAPALRVSSGVRAQDQQ